MTASLLGETDAGLFEQVIEPLALLPAHRVVGVLARSTTFGGPKRQRDRFDDAAQRRGQLRGRAQLHDRRAGDGGALRLRMSAG